MHPFLRPAVLFAVALTLAASPALLAQTSGTDSSVGLSSRDGISLSGTDVLITRNGISQPMKEETALSNGVKVLPDGHVIGTDGSKTMLRQGQVVTFDGRLVNAPVVESVPRGQTGLTPNAPAASSPAP